MSYAEFPGRRAAVAAHASADARADFIKKTYLHLGGAILAYVGLSAMFVSTDAGRSFAATILGVHPLLSLVLFLGASWIANRWAANAVSVPKQYAGLGLFVVVMAVISTPLLFVARYYAGPEVLPTAALLTALTFGGLTASVFLTGKDFSFMGQVLSICLFVAIGVVAASFIFGFTLGTLYSGAMVLLFGGYILYYTSNVLHHYPIGSHVAAALALFSAVSILFLHILRLVMAFSSDD